MIIITGAAGFIGSCLVAKLNSEGLTHLVLSDDFSVNAKQKNYQGKKFLQKVERNVLPEWLEQHAAETEFVFHLGARTNTAEFNADVLDTLNTKFSENIWKFCTKHQIPLLYASSAATYGNGEFGYCDDHSLIKKFKPLNPYGESKNEFDKFVLAQTSSPPFWYGIKFFNVYGPNEFHKGRMASVIFHAYNQLKETGKIKLFTSHKQEFKDGEQLRDFVYVKDVVDVLSWFMHTKPFSGIYNLGTGKAETFLQLAYATAMAAGIPLQIQWIEIPEDIRNTYQYYTQACMDKLFATGYTGTFHSLSDGVDDYVKNFLLPGRYV